MKKKFAILLSAFLIAIFAISITSGAQASGPEFCWLDSYGRGVGTIPSSCAEGQQKIGALCYKNCPDGMKRKGFDCHSVCPKGTRDDGLFCRAAEYGRGAGYAWRGGDGFSDRGMRKRCERKHGKGNCEKDGAIFYPKCRTGYQKVGCCICRPKKPDCSALGLKAGIDLSCAKRVNIGKPETGTCGKGEQKDAGLCYKNCRAGYGSIGPVCWGKKPKGWVACGMGAAKDRKTCASIVFGQVSSVGTMAMNIATMGGSGAATAAASSEEKASRLAKLKKQYADMKAAYDAAKKSSKALQDAEKAYNAADRASKTYKAANTAQNVVTEEDIIRLSAQILAIVDTSGVAATVGAYTYPKCSKYFKK